MYTMRFIHNTTVNTYCREKIGASSLVMCRTVRPTMSVNKRYM